MGSKLNRASAQLCFDAAFVTSGKFKGFADFRLAKGKALKLFLSQLNSLDGTLFAVKVQSADGFRALLKREQGVANWTPIEIKAGVKNAGMLFK